VFGRPVDLSHVTLTGVAVAVTSLVLALAGLLIFAALLALLGLRALQRLDDNDQPENTSIAPKDLDRILAREDLAAQNHLTAIST
ncbi:hypothetical protein, partial [Mesorhizobium sp. M2E.F.Ca.ET.209.01.1.1]